MAKKGEMSLLKAWLIIAASLIDDILITAIIFICLWLFHVEITWLLVIIVIVIMAVFVLIMHKAVIPAIRRRIAAGVEEMVGRTGEVMEPLNPVGTIKIEGEYWKATTKGTINQGEEVEVVGIDGLILKVRKKKSEK
jgi:membrane-bound ClpP family serine protease